MDADFSSSEIHLDTKRMHIAQFSMPHLQRGAKGNDGGFGAQHDEQVGQLSANLQGENNRV